MKEKNDGGAAFPRSGYEDRTHGDMPDGNGCIKHEDGMTLRDYFAAKALQGLFANQSALSGSLDLAAAGHGSLAQNISRMAFAFADAMLAERDKE